MIILDTNIVSEPMKTMANAAVLTWLDQQAPQTLYLTSVSLAELLIGVEGLPDGKRKAGLGEALGDLLFSLFDNRILPFDQSAATAYAPLIAKARNAGRSIGFADGQIAAIAICNGFAIATRDTEPFEAAGVTVINPFEDDQ